MNQRGQSTVEVVLLFPLLMVLIFLIFEMGRVFGSWIIVTNAVREGARVAAVNTNDSTSDATINKDVVGAGQFLFTNYARPPYLPACTNGQASTCISIAHCLTVASGDPAVQVYAQYQLFTLTPISVNIPLVGPIGYPGSLTVAASSTMRAEQGWPGGAQPPANMCN